MKKSAINVIFLFFVTTLFLAGFILAFSKKGGFEGGCLSLTFDDGLKSHYQTVYPMLKEKSLGATFFIIANRTIDDLGRNLMSETEIREIAEDGFEIGSHTLSHKNLKKQSYEGIELELRDSKEILEKKHGINLTSLAFPYGKYNKDILEISEKYYLIQRDFFPFIFRYSKDNKLVKGVGISKYDSSARVCRKIKYAKKNNLWLVLVFHDVNENPPRWDTSTENFREIIDCAESSGIKIDSLYNCGKNKNV